jgi:hypothetical protein
MYKLKQSVKRIKFHNVQQFTNGEYAHLTFFNS